MRVRTAPILLVLVAAAADASRGAESAQQPGLVTKGFIYDTAPFPQCHASTIVQTKEGLVAAWFGGEREKRSDVSIWISRHDGKSWSPIEKVADGVQHADKRYPCWNPVLFQPKDGPLMLFYKVGPSPEEWWGMLTTSTDVGKTWAEPHRLPEDILGPVRNKPIQLPTGELLCPSSTEVGDTWRVHFEVTGDLGKTWKRIGPVNDGVEFGAIQPALLVHPDGKLQALCRSLQNTVTETWSADGGRTWSAMAATTLPNPNAGIDAVTLRDGRHLLVYNPTRTPKDEWGGPRSPLSVAISHDGKSWNDVLVLEDEAGGEFSYPAVIQSSDGLVHIAYTWNRTKVRHVVVDPAKLKAIDGDEPTK